jgi:hypothetical protein
MRAKRGTDHIDLMLLRGHQEIGIDIAAVEQMGLAAAVKPKPTGRVLWGEHAIESKTLPRKNLFGKAMDAR